MKEPNKKLLNKIDKLNDKIAELELFRLVGEQSTDFISIVGLDGKLVFVSPSYKLLGYDPDKLIGTEATQLLHPADRKRMVPLFKKVISGSFKKGTTKRFYLRLRNKSGKYIEVESNAKLIKDESGDTRILSIVRDISDRKRANDNLKKQQYYLTQAQKMGSIGTWDLDLIKNELIWTDQNYINFGVPLGTPLTYEIFLDCIYPDDREYVNTEWMAAIDGKPYDIEHRLIVDGEVRWMREKADVEFDKSGKAIKAIGFTQDITKNKLSQNNLEKSKETSERYLNIAAEIIISLDTSGNITLLNDSGYKLLGYKRGSLIGKNWFDTCLHKEIKEEVGIVFESLMNKDIENTVNYENTVITKNGIEKIIYWYNTILIDNNDNIVGLLSSGEDITKRKQAEQSLKESEILLNNTQQLGKIGGWIWNIKNESMYWTDETYLIHEIDKKEIPAGSTKHIERGIKCYDEKDRPIILEAFENCIKTGKPYSLEFPFTTFKGTKIWIRTLAQAEKENGKVANITGYIMDITEQKNITKALEKSEIQFRQLADYTYDWEYMVKPNGKYIYLSPSCERITGYTPQEFIKNKNLLTEITKPDYTEKAHAHFKNENNKDTPIFTMEISIITKSGEERWLEHNCTPIFDDDGKYIGRRSNNQDITERKQTEIILKSRLNELEVWHDVTVGRELKMIELKKEINELLEKFSKQPKYKIPT
jgi:PAS domain S-box-containing protein